LPANLPSAVTYFFTGLVQLSFQLPFIAGGIIMLAGGLPSFGQPSPIPGTSQYPNQHYLFVMMLQPCPLSDLKSFIHHVCCSCIANMLVMFPHVTFEFSP
jgi:hypothetical protein